jgi:hypothetical protein
LQEIVFEVDQEQVQVQDKLLEDEIIETESEMDEQREMDLGEIQNFENLEMQEPEVEPEQEVHFSDTIKIENPQQYLLKSEDSESFSVTANKVTTDNDQVEVIEIQFQNQSTGQSEMIGINVEDLEGTEWIRDYEEQEYLDQDVDEDNELDDDNFLITHYESDASIISRENITKNNDEKYFE